MLTTGPIDGEGRGVLSAMWHYRLLVVGVVVAAIGMGAGIALLQPITYTASARVYMADPRAEGVFATGPVGDDGRRQQNRVERFRSEPVLTRAAALVGTSLQLGELREVVDVVPAAAADEITVTARSPHPVMARNLANAVVDAYREQYRAEAIADAERTVAVLDAELVALQKDLERIDAELAPLVEASDGFDDDDALPTSQVTILTLQREAESTLIRDVLVRRAQVLIEGRAAEDIARVEAAETPPSPSRDPAMTISLALALGVVASALLAVWREERRRARVADVAAQDAMAGIRRPVLPPPQPAGRR